MDFRWAWYSWVNGIFADLQQLLELFLGNLILHEIKVEKVLGQRSRIWFIVRVVISLEVRVREALLHGHSVLGSDYQDVRRAISFGYDASRRKQYDLQVKVFLRKSMAAGLAMGYKLSKDFLARKGSARMYSLERLEVMS
jgi:hypothetical protein